MESALGRITLCVLFATLVGLGLTLLFVLPTAFSPFLLKFVVIIGIGLAASFMSRRVLAGRSPALRAAAAAFAGVIALAVLSPITLGFVGLNLLRSYAIATPLDAAIQLTVLGLAVAAGQVAWAPRRRTVMVEPREEVEVNVAPPRSAPARPEPRAAQGPRVSVAAATPHPRRSQPAPSFLTRARASVSRFFTPAPSTRKLRSARPARKRTRGSGITLSAQERHVCPYCLEPVTKRDARGIKICKVCKTWHHADCWEITGVCQVPHAFQN
ncbi:MAG: hypothetical protein KIT08_01935 [Anaerolineales bacterium]|nr:MAG: hypothetical protein KIT08_01935 [Anaerolineales bacterium]